MVCDDIPSANFQSGFFPSTVLGMVYQDWGLRRPGCRNRVWVSLLLWRGVADAIHRASGASVLHYLACDSLQDGLGHSETLHSTRHERVYRGHDGPERSLHGVTDFGPVPAPRCLSICGYAARIWLPVVGSQLDPVYVGRPSLILHHPPPRQYRLFPVLHIKDIRSPRDLRLSLLSLYFLFHQAHHRILFKRVQHHSLDCTPLTTSSLSFRPATTLYQRIIPTSATVTLYHTPTERQPRIATATTTTLLTTSPPPNSCKSKSYRDSICTRLYQH